MHARLVALLVLAVWLPGLAACASGKTADGQAAMLAALAVIDGSGIHQMADRLTSPKPTIDPSDLLNVRHARIAALAAPWPADVEKKAQSFAAAADKLAAALEKNDVDGAAKAILGTHAEYHALSDAGWEVVGDKAGVSAHLH